MKFILIILVLFNVTSCANYVKNLHSQIDREERRVSGRTAPQPHMANRYNTKNRRHT